MPVKNAVVNFTQRRRLTQDEYVLELDWQGRYPAFHRFSNETQWDNDFPPNSPVCVEFLKHSAYHVVELGTVGDIQLPTDVVEKTLAGFDRTRNISYRLLIYAPAGPTGKLLGRSATHSIPSPHKDPPKEGEQVPLLAIVSAPLPRGVPSLLRFPETSNDLVEILVSDDNSELYQAINDSPERNPAYYALTMVPYLQAIATRLAFEVKRDPDMDLGNINLWQHRWNDCFTRFYNAKSIGDVDLDDDAEVSKWIKGIVNWWCKRHSNPNRDIQALVGGV